MGLFLSMSGVIGASQSEVARALRKYAESHHGEMREESLTTDDDGCMVITEGLAGVTVFYPGDFFDWDEASRFLSEDLRKPVFSFHIHDGDFWMYVLYDGGAVVDQFNPVPDYWGDVSDAEQWQGNAREVSARVPGLSPESVSKYLIRWGDEVFESRERTKAYPDDQFSCGDDWQLVDFMRRVGLSYPVDDYGNGLGTTYRFVCEVED
jgi:hypothetical protein